MCDHRLGGYPDSVLRCVDTSGKPHTHVFHGETVRDNSDDTEAMDD